MKRVGESLGVGQGLCQMKRFSQWRVLPHEVVFAGFLLVTFARFCLVGDVVDAAVYGGFLLVNMVSVGLCVWRPSARFWRWRLWFYPVAVVLLFMLMKGAIPKIAPLMQDSVLMGWDERLAGGSLALRWQRAVRPWLTELLSGCYLFYFLYLVVVVGDYFSKELAVAKRFCAGFAFVYAAGFFGYSFVPALGPWKAMAGQFHVPLDGWWLTGLNTAIVSWGSNGVDVFPSLHCALSLYFLLFDRKFRGWRFKAFLLPCIGLWFSTVYLRYHYFVDVVCGFVLGTIGFWVASWRYGEAAVSAGELVGLEAVGKVKGEGTGRL